jgi:hypothetical protein
LGNPVAVDRASDSLFYVLSADRNVRRFNISGERITLNAQFAVTGSPVDFTYSRSGEVESLFICSINFGKGVISRYSVDGKLMQSWWLWHPCGGIDYDPGRQAVYFGATDTREIYRIDIRADTTPQSLGELPAMEKMGPIALDSTGRTLFVGDISGGALFEFDIPSRSSRTVTTQFGTVAALYVDPTSRSLYIVDSVARTVFVATLDSLAPKRPTSSGRSSANRPITKSSVKIAAQIVSRAPELRNPSGVIPIDNGRYLISDYGVNALFLVASDGKVSASFPYTAARIENPCTKATIKERTWQRIELPGGAGMATLALSDLYRISRGTDASRLYVIDSSSLYKGTSGKFDKHLPPPPPDISKVFSFSEAKGFPAFEIQGRTYNLRITGIDHSCVTPGCQSLTMELCPAGR